MGTLKGTLKQKLEGQFVLFYDGKEVTHPLSQRVAPFAGSLKEGDSVEFDLKGDEISFIKKEYKPYVKAPPKPAVPAPTIKAVETKTVTPPVAAVTTSEVKVDSSVQNTPTPAVVANTHSGDVKVVAPKPEGGVPVADIEEPKMTRVHAAGKIIKPDEVTPGTSPKTAMSEKDYKMTCMSALKGAVSIVEGVIEAAPDFLKIEKGTISLGEMCDDVSDEVIKQAEKLLEWMDKNWQEKRFK